MDYDYSFSREINDCDSDRCTLMRCTVGPMARDDIVTFKIRSRLFTETQIKVCLMDAVSRQNPIFWLQLVCFRKNAAM